MLGICDKCAARGGESVICISEPTLNYKKSPPPHKSTSFTHSATTTDPYHARRMQYTHISTETFNAHSTKPLRVSQSSEQIQQRTCTIYESFRRIAVGNASFEQRQGDSSGRRRRQRRRFQILCDNNNRGRHQLISTVVCRLASYI